MKKIFTILAFSFFSISFAQIVSIIPQNSSWKYLANGSNQGTAWRSTTYNDTSWPSGNAELGYGDGGEATVVSYGPNAFSKYRTTYFRKTFSIVNPAAYSTFTLNLMRDDGAVVYLNGIEVLRSNMPSGTISYSTFASSAIGSPAESTFYSFNINPGAFVAGNNVLAIEIHQSAANTPDLSFNLKLDATTTCAIPSSLSASAVTSSSASLSWSAIAGAGSYNIRYRKNGTSTWTNTTSTIATKQITGLLTASSYQFQVRAVCTATSAYSALANFTTLSATCGTPTSLSATSISESSATLSWLAVAGAGSYTIQYRVVGAPTWITATSTIASISAAGLTSNSNYEFRVQAVCAVTGNYSTTANFTTLVTTCDTPTSLSATSISESSATLSWLAVAGAGSYNIQYRVVGAPTWITATSTIASISAAGLTSNSNYEFRVQAVCAVTGNYSTTANFTTLVTTCDTPSSLSATSISESSATLSWLAVAGAGSYNIQYRIVGTPTWITAISTIPTLSAAGLTSNSNYEFQVQGVCAVTGNYSATTNFMTIATTCDTPSSLSATAITASSATLSWSAVAGALSYNIQYRVTGTSTWITTTSASTILSVSGLTSNSNYEFQVQAMCSVAGFFSAPINFQTPGTGTTVLVAANSSWKYLDNGTNQGTAWRAIDFNDTSWASGNSELGYGDGDETTVVGYGPNASNKYVTTYFRKSFIVPDPSVYNMLTLDVVRDDGIVVYINGNEVYRNNMPTGTISYNTVAGGNTGDEAEWRSQVLNPSVLSAGINVIAVEVHQQAYSSSDLSFNARLYAPGNGASVNVIRGAYLQKLTPESVTIRWRTDIACNSSVQFGTDLSYGTAISDAALTTEHIVTIAGLTPATKYFYSIGTTTQTLQGDVKNNFYTAPVAGTTAPVRIWAIGDFGDGSAAQLAVRNSYAAYAGTTPTNLWLWLGDNAYQNGTDSEYQTKVFDVYPDQFKSMPLFPSPGNHDYAEVDYLGSQSLTTNFPYFSIFSIPQNGESGGVTSNTPKYYSYDYGNIHFISLDSFGALNTPGSPMYTWLNNDLAANTQKWTVVYFHHPPYTKGSHDSDSEIDSKNMRINIVPLLESYQVDLVISGHSHANERSYLIKGHSGNASTFTPAMKVSTATNNFVKTPPYDGTIYAVCGTSAGNDNSAQPGYPMPCMFFSDLSYACSMVIDISGDLLSCKYLASTGAIVDEFTITKSPAAKMASLKKSDEVEVIVSGSELSVNYLSEDTAEVKMTLVNMLGQKVMTLEPIGFHQEGRYNVAIPLSDIPISEGLYFLQMTINGKPFVKKVYLGN